MPETPVTTVVFDLGNVLVRWDREFLYRWLIPDPNRRRQFLDEVLTLEVNADLDRGTPLGEVTASLARRHPEWSLLIDAFRSRWIDTIGAHIEGSVEILQELHAAGTPIYALSNWGRDTFEIARDGLEWLTLFDGLVISGHEGVVKPDAAVFELLCARFGFEPAAAVFIDDSVVNIEAAQALGFDAILFTDAAALRDALTRRELLGMSSPAGRGDRASADR